MIPKSTELTPQYVFQSPTDHLREENRTIQIPPEDGPLVMAIRVEVFIQWFDVWKQTLLTHKLFVFIFNLSRA